MLMPGGLGAAFGDARDGALRWYARRKGIRVPSLVADTLVEAPIRVRRSHGARSTRPQPASSSNRSRRAGRDGRAKPPTVWFTIRGFPFHIPRTPRRFFEEMSGGEALFPLIVLVGLNCVNQLDQTVFGVLGPDIQNRSTSRTRASSRWSRSTQLGGLLLAVPLAYYSDRLQRVAIAVIGAAVWAVFGIVTGLSVTVLMLVVARTGSGMGRAVVTPTHNSLMSDYYPPEVRADVFGFHSIGLALGALLGPVIGGLLAHYWGWRLPFFVFTIPTFVFVILGLRLQGTGPRALGTRGGGRERGSGRDRRDPTFVRRIRPHPLAGADAAPDLVLAAVPRGLVHRPGVPRRRCTTSRSSTSATSNAASSPRCAEPAQIIAILLGIPLAARLMLRDPGLGMRLLAVLGTVIAGCWIVVRAGPDPRHRDRDEHRGLRPRRRCSYPASTRRCRSTIPPKVRSLGFAMAALFIVPGLLALYVVGGIADAYGIRAGAPHRRPDLPDRRVDPVVGIVLRAFRHQPRVDVDRGPGRGDAQAASRAK